MKQAFRKNIFRAIRRSMGRYMAIFAIIALGVGFFTGLKASKPAMLKTGQEYLQQRQMFDFRLISTWGFTEDEVAAIREAAHVTVAEGAVWEDFLYVDEQGQEIGLKAMSITESVNTLALTAGRMPQAGNECVLDDSRYKEGMIGMEITIGEGNSQDVRDAFRYDAYTVVGFVRSPLYLNIERGNTTIGNGKLEGFLYLPQSGFDYEYWKEVYIKADTEAVPYTRQYEDAVEGIADGLEGQATEIIGRRYQQELADALAEIEDGERKLQEAEESWKDGQQELAEKEQELLDGEAALAEGEAKHQDGMEEYQAGLAQYQEGYAKYQDGLAAYEKNYADYQAYAAMLGANAAAYGQQLAAMEASLAQAKAELDAAYGQLEVSRGKLTEAKAELDAAGEEISKNRASLKEGREKLEQGKEELAQGEREIAENRDKLADSRKKLDEVEEPKLYTLDRSSNVGYFCFENDIDIVEGIARVFPIFFFLIAALVCSTTMTRMVDDERTQIGTLRAMGYTEGAILAKYLIYSGSAAGLGGTVGFLLGVRLFPAAIWHAYSILYGFARLSHADHYLLFAMSLLTALLCSMGTAYAACRMELKHVPAELIRPKAPPAGKRIFLERIAPLWKRMKFLHKVSARNIFRFKKRMFMMILGIAGCTALVLTGFGVRDSVMNIVNMQYDNILQYHISASYSKGLTAGRVEEVQGKFGAEIEAAAPVMEASADILHEGASQPVSLLISHEAPPFGDVITSSISFHGEKDGKPQSLPGRGEILIDNRTAEELSLSPGDTVTLRIGDRESEPLAVSGIFENYVQYYAYLDSATYEAYAGEGFEPKTLYLSLREGADPYRISTYLSDMEDAANISVVADMRARVQNMLQSMNVVVALVIGCAAALAFIVLFNLGNINISERVREIATLKVLGFYPRESGAYVFRESLVLSLMGIAVGLPLGMALHAFVMDQIRVEKVSFQVQILPLSYVCSVLAVIGFTVFVDLAMRRKIEGIDMAESLKSIE